MRVLTTLLILSTTQFTIIGQTICDCNGVEHDAGVLSWLGDGYADQGTYSYNGNLVDFDCATWGYDCGDISGAPVEDPYLVCSGNLPPNNGCGSTCTNLQLELEQTNCEWNGASWDAVLTCTFHLDGDFCYVHEVCFNAVGQAPTCFDLVSQDLVRSDGESLLLSGLDGNAVYEVYYSTADGTVSSVENIQTETCTEGCTNPFAANYVGANAEDGSCVFEAMICDCDGNQHDVGVLTWLGDGYADDAAFAYNDVLVDFNCETWGYDCGDIAGVSATDPHNVCGGELPPNNGCDASEVLGCTDALACNYDASATLEDGSCDFSCVGCTDPTACNYNPEATQDDGSCGDTIAPVISCPADVSVTLALGDCVSNLVLDAPEVTDCSTYTLTNSLNGTADASGSFDPGITVITWTATDEFGNTSSCVQQVAVYDQSAPELDCAGVVNVTASGSCTASVAVPIPSITGECGGYTLVNDFNGTGNASGVYPAGMTLVLWTATDDAGNVSTCTTVVEVSTDFSCPADVSFALAEDSCSAYISNPFPSTVAPCSTMMDEDFEAGLGVWSDGGADCAHSTVAGYAGSGVGSLRLRDNSSSSYSRSVALDMSAVSQVTFSFHFVTVGFGSSSEDFWLEISTDNGSSWTTVQTWAHTVDFYNDVAEDESLVIEGPFSSETRFQWICDASTNSDRLYIDDISITACSGCGLASVTNDFNGTDDASGSYGPGSTLVTWTLTGNDGSTYHCYQTVDVFESNAPVITCVGTVTETASEGVSEWLVNVPAAAVSDDCGFSLTNSWNGTADATDFYPIGSTTVVWDASDLSGNTSTCLTEVIVQQPVIAQDYVWAGNNDQWNDPNNWDIGSVPPTGANVIVPFGTENAPFVSAEDVLQIGSLWLDGGATLSLAGTLMVSGDVELSSSSLVDLEGTLVLNGAAQELTTAAVLGNLTIQSTDTVTVNGSLELLGTLSVDGGVLSIPSNHMTLRSNASKTGSIGSLSDVSAVVCDSLTLERHYPAGGDAWRMMCAPFNDLSFEDWNDDLPTTGFPGSDWPNWPSEANPWSNMYLYNETFYEGAEGDLNVGFEVPDSLTQSIPLTSGVYTYWEPVETTVDVTGMWNRGDVVFALDYTVSDYGAAHDGWNLISNPYPSAIDWNSSEWTRSNVGDAIYMFDPIAGAYHAYVNGLGTGGMDGTIASSQAFWVQAVGPSPVLEAKEQVKVDVQGIFLKDADETPIESVPLQLVAENYIDEAILGFHPGATDEVDATFDARKFFASNQDHPDLSILSGEESVENLAISISDYPQVDRIVQLEVNPKSHTSLEIRFDDTAPTTYAGCVILVDTELDVQQALLPGDAYAFDWTDESTANRFQVHVAPALAVEASAQTCAGANDGQLVLSMGQGSVTAEWGQVGEAENNIATAVDGSITLDGLAEGIYALMVTGEHALCASTVDTVEVTTIELAEFNVVSTPATCLWNTASLEVMGSEDWTVEVYGPGLEWSGTLATEVQQWNALEPGVYSIVASNVCDNQWVETVDLNDPDALSMEVIVPYPVVEVGQPMAFQANANQALTSLVWTFEPGAQVLGEANTSYVFENEGAYAVTVFATSENCSVYQVVEVVATPALPALEEEADQQTALYIQGDHLMLNGELGIQGPVQLRVMDTSGRLVRMKEGVNAEEFQPVSLSSLPEGVYIIQLMDSSGNEWVNSIVKAW